jgi:hypothetical protein
MILQGVTMENNEPLEGIEPEYETTDEGNAAGGIRYKTVILLLVFLIPMLITAFQLLSNQISGDFVHAVQPHLPQLDTVITF